jgi:hypothetical protein
MERRRIEIPKRDVALTFGHANHLAYLDLGRIVAELISS